MGHQRMNTKSVMRSQHTGYSGDKLSFCFVAVMWRYNLSGSFRPPMKQSLAVVNTLVSCQISWCREALCTEATVKWAILCVNALVYFQTSWSSEALSTEAAGKRSTFYMNALMWFQTSWLSEALCTETTNKRPATSLNAITNCTPFLPRHVFCFAR